MNENIIEKSIRCDCIGGEHYLHFTYCKDDNQLYIDLQAKNHPRGKWFWQVLWDLIRGKDICQDGIILEKRKQAEIIDFLDSIPDNLVDIDLPPDVDEGEEHVSKNKILNIVEECENKYPMSGKPDVQASYKNGWYDCAYHIKNKIK